MPQESPDIHADEAGSASSHGPGWPSDLGLARVLPGRLRQIHDRHLGMSQMLVVYSLVGLAMLGGLVTFRAAALIGLGWLAVGVIGSIVLVAGAAFGIRFALRRAHEDGRSFSGNLFSTGGSARITLVCSVREAERWRADPPRPDAGLDPEIARVPMAIGMTGRDRRFAWLGAFLGAGFGVLAARFVSSIPVYQSVNIWMILGFAAAGALVLPEFLFPTWVRVVPGRVDVIRDRLFGSGFAEITRVDLRGSPVLITRRAVVVDPVEFGAGEPDARHRHAISLAATPRRRAMIDAMVRAACSRVDPPDLPDDRLLG